MGFLSSLFGKRKKTTNLEPMTDTPQAESRKFLQDLIQKGEAGGLTLGEAYTGELGDFDIRPTEQQALSLLSDFVGTEPQTQDFDVARDVLTEFATSEYDPDIDAFKRRLALEVEDADDLLRREQARTGSRFSTAAVEQQRELSERRDLQLLEELARQREVQAQRRLGAASALPGLATEQEGSELRRLSAGLQLGGFERALENQRIQADLNEFNRQRQEELSRLNLGQTLATSTVPFGLKSITTEQPSVFGQILGQVSPLVGSYNQARYGTQGQATLGDLTRLLTRAGTGGFGGGIG